MPRRSALCDAKKLREVAEKARTKNEILEEFGLAPIGGNYITLDRYAEEFDIELPVGHAYSRNPDKRVYSDEEIFRDGPRRSRAAIRRRVIRYDLVPYECAICGITEWLDEKLSLHLDHANGKRNDNRLENLRFLCPNCHSQTETYGGRNARYD